MNTITVTGNLTKDPELRTTANGVSVCNITVAVKRPRKSDTTDFLNCVIWRHNAEYVSKYAAKGSRVGIKGIMTTRGYEDKEGNKRVAYEIEADDVEVYGKTQTQAEQTQAAQGDFTDMGVFDDEECPF